MVLSKWRSKISKRSDTDLDHTEKKLFKLETIQAIAKLDTERNFMYSHFNAGEGTKKRSHVIASSSDSSEDEDFAPTGVVLS